MPRIGVTATELDQIVAGLSMLPVAADLHHRLSTYAETDRMLAIPETGRRLLVISHDGEGHERLCEFYHAATCDAIDAAISDVLMKPNDRRVVHSSKSSDWETPPALFAALDREFSFRLDAAANKANATCRRYFGPDQADTRLRDGLAVDWLWAVGGELYVSVFLNPPYSREQGIALEPWIEKAAAEAARGLVVVALVPHRPDTKWWHRYVMHAAEIRQIPHRVKFLRDGLETDSAGFPSAVVIWRPNPGYLGPLAPRVVTWTYRETKA